MALDNSVVEFVKDWLWAPALGMVAWAWTRNEKEHDMLRERTEHIKQNTSDGYSVLNDRVMDYVDSKVNAMQDENRRKSDKMNDHIVRLFENAERDRATAAERHIELLHAIHTGLAGKADK